MKSREKMPYKIYSLFDNKTDVVFYVGMTSADLKTRLAGHKTMAKNGLCGERLAVKIMNLESNIGIRLLETVGYSKNKAKIKEGWWMDRFKHDGVDLANTMPSVIKKPTPYSQAKLSVCLPKEVINKIEKMRQKELRSMSNMITVILDAGIKKIETSGI